MMVKVDKEKCIGCGTCMAICGEVFEFDGENKSVVKAGADLVANEAKIIEAKDACPVSAIIVE